MRVQLRLIFLAISLLVLVVVGRVFTGDFSFALQQFWFTAGFFLLVLLSLVDQPHFSKDANVFVNATTAWVSLLLVAEPKRDSLWWAFFAWSSYLIVTSYALMFSRSDTLQKERPLFQLVSRVNREIGRPEALFSAFLLWGCAQQFGLGSPRASALFVFWAVFMILNLPALAATIDGVFTIRGGSKPETGLLISVTSPRIGEAHFPFHVQGDLTGRVVGIRTIGGHLVGRAVVVDDRVVAGKRVGRLAITETFPEWSGVSGSPAGTVMLDIPPASEGPSGDIPMSVADSGSNIGTLVFHIHPDQVLQSGEVLTVQAGSGRPAYYQAISALICQSTLPDGNHMHTVRVSAGQLGFWDVTRCRFEPNTWVAPAGQVIHRLSGEPLAAHKIPVGHETVGRIPSSAFPVHVSIEDAVTHNTAIIGVTGSGKSYLAFHLIEAMIKCGVKVMVLDCSRQHDLHLVQHNPTALKTTADVTGWLQSKSAIGIHQFGLDKDGYPKATADFVAAAFDEIAKTKLERGRNHPARLCVVFEEAHSLIPEWNQVAQKGDEQHVNRTARVILQGRKFGMGALVITQRTANVTKTILNQCNTIFALQSFDQTGLDFLRNYMGEEYSQAISTLPTRHAVLVGKASSSARPLLMAVEDMGGRWKEASEPTTGLPKKI